MVLNIVLKVLDTAITHYINNINYVYKVNLTLLIDDIIPDLENAKKPQPIKKLFKLQNRSHRVSGYKITSTSRNNTSDINQHS